MKNLKLTIKIINYEKIKTLTQFKILAIIIIIQQKKVRYRWARTNRKQILFNIFHINYYNSYCNYVHLYLEIIFIEII